MRYEGDQNENKGLTFAQAAITATKPNICPCCRQTLPQDRRNFNMNYDKNWVMVPNTLRSGNMSPSTMNFPNNETGEAVSPDPRSRKTVQSEEIKKEKKSRRKRKNKGQIKKLEDEFSKNPHWSNDDVERISKELKLDKSQVYKWNWDQKKKLNILPSKVYVVQMPEDSKDGVKKGESKQVYVKSIQDVIKLQQLASTNTKGGNSKNQA